LALTLAFRSLVPNAYRCDPDSGDPISFDYEREDLEVVWSVLNKVDGSQLVGVRLKPSRNNCDGPPEASWRTQTLLLDQEARNLGVDLVFVDAADFDANGDSEALFWYSGYNEDGYVLYSSGFTNQVRFTWNYH
jgi:hypothetical protein